jgi:hypothetical protein
MEIFLNSAWALLSFALLCLWLRTERCRQGHRRISLIAFCVLAAILFPVISITDDLQIAQNPAQIESSLNLDRKSGGAHPVFFTVAGLPSLFSAGPALDFSGFAAKARLSAPDIDQPALSAIKSRPPPFA